MLEYYSKVAPPFNEPLYAKPARFTLSEVEGYSGVRGALRSRLFGSGAAYSMCKQFFLKFYEFLDLKFPKCHNIPQGS